MVPLLQPPPGRSTERSRSARRHPSPSRGKRSAALSAAPLPPVPGAVLFPRTCSSVPQIRQTRRASPFVDIPGRLVPDRGLPEGEVKHSPVKTARSNAPRMDSQRNTINDYPSSFNLYPVRMKKKPHPSARDSFLRLKQSAKRKMGMQSTINAGREFKIRPSHRRRHPVRGPAGDRSYSHL